LVPPLTPKEIENLKLKFLIKLKELSESQLQSSIKKQEVWELTQAGAYSKELVMPMIVQKLMDEGLLVEGDTKDEIRRAKIKKGRESIRLLELFNEIINSAYEGKMGVTLNSSGLIVSGNLISLKKFYEQISQALQESIDSQDSDARQGWKLLFDRLIESLPNTEELDSFIELIGIGYVCLEDARFFPGLGSIPSSGTLWIGKLESVDGFSLGKLG